MSTAKCGRVPQSTSVKGTNSVGVRRFRPAVVLGSRCRGRGLLCLSVVVVRGVVCRCGCGGRCVAAGGRCVVVVGVV